MATKDPYTHGPDFSEVMLLIQGWATLEPWLAPYCEEIDGDLYCFGNFLEFSGAFSFTLTDPGDRERFIAAIDEHMRSDGYLHHAAERRRLDEERAARAYGSRR